MQIRLRRSTNWAFWLTDTRWRPILCNKALRRYLSVPRGVKTLYLVFTKRPREDSFEIELVPAPRYYSIPSRSARLVDHPKLELMHSLQDEMEAAIDRGYRWGHIDYVED